MSAPSMQIRTPFFTVKRGVHRIICEKHDGTCAEVGPNLVKTPTGSLMLRGSDGIQTVHTDFDRVEFRKRQSPIDIAVTCDEVVVHSPGSGTTSLEW